MSTIFAILYVNIDDPELTDVLQLCKTKEDAIDSLLELAHYRKDGEDGVTQYHEPIDSEQSFNDLRERVAETMKLDDVDLYRIVPLLSPN